MLWADDGGPRTRGLDINWQMVGIETNGVEVLQMTRLSFASTDGLIDDAVLGLGIVKELVEAFDVWLVKDGTVDLGTDLPTRTAEQYRQNAETWQRWRAEYVNRVWRKAVEPRRGPRTDDAESAKLVETAIALGGLHGHRWLQELAKLQPDIGNVRVRHNHTKKRIDRLRRAGWLAPQDGQRRPPGPGPRLIAYRNGITNFQVIRPSAMSSKGQNQ